MTAPCRMCGKPCDLPPWPLTKPNLCSVACAENEHWVRLAAVRAETAEIELQNAKMRLEILGYEKLMVDSVRSCREAARAQAEAIRANAKLKRRLEQLQEQDAEEAADLDLVELSRHLGDDDLEAYLLTEP